MLKKFFSQAVLLCTATLLLIGCSSNQDVASNSWIQKRKYTKGYHIEKMRSDKMEIIQAEPTQTASTTTPIDNTTNTHQVTTPQSSSVALETSVNTTDEQPTPTASSNQSTAKKLTQKVFEKAKENGATAKKEFQLYRAHESAQTASVSSPMGVTKTFEMHPRLRKALICAGIALLLSIIGSIMIASSASRVASTGTATGAGIGAGVIIAWIGWIFWIISIVFFIMWLVDIL